MVYINYSDNIVNNAISRYRFLSNILGEFLKHLTVNYTFKLLKLTFYKFK